MKNQPLFLAMVMAGAFSLVAAGCILGEDSNHNSMIFGAQAGSSGTAGSNGSAGMTGTAGSGVGPLVGVPMATFDTSTQSFAFSTYDEATNLAVHNGGMPPTIDWDGTDGSPTSPSGSLKVFAPYSGANQYVDIQSPTFPATALANWMGGTLHVRVKVDTGSTFTGQIEPYADTTSTFAFVGTSTNVIMGGGWHDYKVVLDSAMTHITGSDSKQVILFGVHIGSGGGGASQGSVTFHIDSFTVEGIAAPATPDAGGTNDDAASGN